MRLLEDAGESTRRDASGRSGRDVDLGNIDQLTELANPDLEIDRGPKQSGRLLFALKLATAIILTSTAITLFPGARPDRIPVAQSLYVSAGVAPAPTASTSLPIAASGPRPLELPLELGSLDGLANSAVELVPLDEPAPGWVEPSIPPENEWVDSGNGVLVPDLLLRLRFCESTNNYQAANNRSTASGAYQFLDGSWDWYGHAERYGVASADLAPPTQQDEAALLTMQKAGFRPWAESRPCWDDPDIDPGYAVARPPAPATTTTAVPTEPSTTLTDSSPSTATSTDTSTDTTVADDTTTTMPSLTVPDEQSTTVTNPSSTSVENSG